MITSFACADTKKLYDRHRVKRFVNIEKTALIKLRLLNSAQTINHLRVPPGNRLELLKGNLFDTYSIRINNQWRICFKFEQGNASEVRIIDYH